MFPYHRMWSHSSMGSISSGHSPMWTFDIVLIIWSSLHFSCPHIHTQLRHWENDFGWKWVFIPWPTAHIIKCSFAFRPWSYQFRWLIILTPSEIGNRGELGKVGKLIKLQVNNLVRLVHNMQLLTYPSLQSLYLSGWSKSQLSDSSRIHNGWLIHH